MALQGKSAFAVKFMTALSWRLQLPGDAALAESTHGFRTRVVVWVSVGLKFNGAWELQPLDLRLLSLS
eukprot:442373-Pyramimonas_sp.AAC.1